MRKEKRKSQRSIPARPRYARWRKSFDAASDETILAELALKGVDLERMRTLLYAAPFLGKIDKLREEFRKVDERLTAAARCLKNAIDLLKPVPGQRRVVQIGMLGALHKQIKTELHIHKQWPKVTHIDRIDLIIVWLANELSRSGISNVNASIAALLNAAEIPGTHPNQWDECAWAPASIKKRLQRANKNPVLKSWWPKLFQPVPPPRPDAFQDSFWESCQKAFLEGLKSR